MASYLFRSAPLSKAEEARKLVAKYVANRETFVKKLVARAILDTQLEVVNVALGYGRSALKFDIDKYLRGSEELKVALDELRLKDFTLRPEEKERALQELTTALEADGFVVTNARTNLITISWPEPEPTPEATPEEGTA